MSKLAFIVTCLGIWLGASPVNAGTLWALDRDGDIYTLNTTTGAASFVADTGLIASNEIEINPANGKAYVLFGSTSNQSLQELNLATGALLGSPVSLGAEFGGLEFVGSTLYGSGNGGATGLHTINITTGATTKIGTGTFNAGGLAYDSSTGTMYGISGANSDFFSINLTTGAATLIDAATVGRALAFGTDGTLYHAGSGASADILKTINPVTGSSTDVGATGTTRILGLAVAVPEPSFMIAAVGFALVISRRRRR